MRQMKVYAHSFCKNAVTGAKHHPGGKKRSQEKDSHAGAVQESYTSYLRFQNLEFIHPIISVINIKINCNLLKNPFDSFLNQVYNTFYVMFFSQIAESC